MKKASDVNTERTTHNILERKTFLSDDCKELRDKYSILDDDNSLLEKLEKGVQLLDKSEKIMTFEEYVSMKKDHKL